jgi:hypothetical protein
VLAVKKVTDIVSEIAAASGEQSAGIEQVNKAVMHLDELTQQNASLVEEASAASQAMAEQARGLHGAMEHYRVGDLGANTAEAKEATRTARDAAPAERRGTGRPWTEKRAAAKRTAAAREASENAVWKEF